MKSIRLLWGALGAMAVIPAIVWAQGQTGRSFAQWDKIQISVTAKLAPNLYILQGSPDLDTNHPDAAGGRVAVLFGPDGILMVDSQDEELHEKVLQTIRTFSSAPIRILVNSHIHSDHAGGDPFAEYATPSVTRDQKLLVGRNYIDSQTRAISANHCFMPNGILVFVVIQ